jgi:hypothetical protein
VGIGGADARVARGTRKGGAGAAGTQHMAGEGGGAAQRRNRGGEGLEVDEGGCLQFPKSTGTSL